MTSSPWLKKDQEYVVLNFSDTGIGIEEEFLDKIFEPFFTTKHDGTGLGLSIVYRILKENEAGIHVRSKEGEGTSFSLLFVAADQ